jgi:hypothetical protein
MLMIRTVHTHRFSAAGPTVLPPGYELLLEDPAKFICGYIIVDVILSTSTG